MKQLLKTFAVLGSVAASVSIAQAQSYYIVGDFEGWNNSVTSPQMTGGPTVYTYAVSAGTGTAGAVDQCKVIPAADIGNWGTTYPGGNLWTTYDSTGANTFYFYPGTISDGWQPAVNRVGFADPGNNSFEIAGDFTNPNWSSDPTAQMGLQPGSAGVYTNIYVVATAGTHYFKFRTPGTWGDFNAGADFGQNTDNGTFTTTSANQAVLFQLDLPNGRWLAGSPAPPPVTNQVVFAVDMTSQILLQYFTPGNSVYVSGAFNSWPGTGVGALVLTNYPPYNGGSNTNIYYGTNTFIGIPGTLATGFKFTDNSPTLPSGDAGYEQIGSTNREVYLLSTNGTLLLPVVSFGNTIADPMDYLTADTLVTFSVNMNNAQTAAGLTPPISPPVAFNSQTMYGPYINGNFLTGGWVDAGKAWSGPDFATANILMTENPIGSGIYWYTYLVKAGQPVRVDYKYAFNDGSDSIDNEAPSGDDHIRYIRSTATGSYTNDMDTYGTQLVEPAFGQMSLGSPSAGTIPFSWLGLPGVHVQTCTNLGNNAWVDHSETDGTNWSIGTMSTNGLLSTTNWPVGNCPQFFRLIKL